MVGLLVEMHGGDAEPAREHLGLVGIEAQRLHGAYRTDRERRGKRFGS